MSSTYKYAGALAQKRRPKRSDSEPAVGAALSIADEATTVDRIRALFEDCGAGHYDPERDNGLGGVQRGWRKVALTLAARHVPGFQFGRAKGRPPEPLDVQFLKDLAAVRGKQRTPSIRAAAVSLAKRPSAKPTKPATLERKARRYKNDK